MRVLRSILTFAGVGLAFLVSFVFGFLEMRSIFAGDFALMNNQFISFLSYLFKGLYFWGISTLAVFIFIFTIKKKDICLVLFAGAFITFAHFEYFVTLIFIAITAILVAITAVGFFKKSPEQK